MWKNTSDCSGELMFNPRASKTSKLISDRWLIKAVRLIQGRHFASAGIALRKAESYAPSRNGRDYRIMQVISILYPIWKKHGVVSSLEK